MVCEPEWPLNSEMLLPERYRWNLLMVSRMVTIMVASGLSANDAKHLLDATITVTYSWPSTSTIVLLAESYKEN